MDDVRASSWSAPLPAHSSSLLVLFFTDVFLHKSLTWEISILTSASQPTWTDTLNFQEQLPVQWDKTGPPKELQSAWSGSRGLGSHHPYYWLQGILWCYLSHHILLLNTHKVREEILRRLLSCHDGKKKKKNRTMLTRKQINRKSCRSTATSS